MTLLFESHDKIDVPSGCAGDAFTWVLDSVWTSDEEFSAFVAETYNLHVNFGLFSLEKTVAGEVGEMIWKWSLPGADQSQLTVVAPMMEPQQPEFKLSFRYAWDNGQGISFFYMNETVRVPASPEQAAFGNFKPPMMHASSGSELFAGRGDYLAALNATNEIVQFGDYLCESRS